MTDFGYSSDIQLFLVVGDRQIQLAQIGPESVMLCDFEDVPRDEIAEIVMVVDGKERRWKVVLPDGIVPFDLEVATSDAS